MAENDRGIVVHRCLTEELRVRDLHATALPDVPERAVCQPIVDCTQRFAEHKGCVSSAVKEASYRSVESSHCEHRSNDDMTLSD